MSAFYDEMAAVALELIGEFGQAVTLSDVTPGTYDPVTGTGTGDLPIAQPAQAILLDYTVQEAGAKLAAGTLVKHGDKKVMVAALGLAWAPELTTLVNVGGTVWTIVNLKVSNPAGTPLVYELHGRR